MRTSISIALHTVLFFVSLLPAAAQVGDTVVTDLNANTAVVRYSNLNFSEIYNTPQPDISGAEIDSVLLYRNITSLVNIANKLLALERSSGIVSDKVSATQLFHVGNTWVSKRSPLLLSKIDLKLLIGLGEKVNAVQEVDILNNMLINTPSNNKPKSASGFNGNSGRESSKSINFELEITNNSSQVLYIYHEGVFFGRVYKGRSIVVTCNGGCQKFEVETTENGTAEKLFCFTNSKKANWTINE